MSRDVYSHIHSDKHIAIDLVGSEHEYRSERLEERMSVRGEEKERH